MACDRLFADALTVGQLGPTLESLLEQARAERRIRRDISAQDLLYAVALLWVPVPGEDVEDSSRMVNLLVDGLRCGAECA